MKSEEKAAWKKWNQEIKPVRLTAEQCLEWLDGMRAFMFEVWEKNPGLREKYVKMRDEGKETSHPCREMKP